MKEIHFFDAAFEKGIGWYRAHFPPPDTAEGGGTLAGESTPYYLYHPLVPERAARVVPAARLIVLLRNPVDRAYSHYHHELRLGTECLPFEEALKAEDDRLHGDGTEEGRDFAHRHFSYLSRGLYAEQLARWRGHFDPQQLFVLKSEDFFDAPLVALAAVLRFLGLPAWKPPGAQAQNPGGYGTTMDWVTRRSLEEHFRPHNEKLYAMLGRTLDW